MKKLLIAGLISFCALGFSAPLETQAEDVWIYSGKGANVYVDTSSIYAKSSTEFNVIVKFNSGSDIVPAVQKSTISLSGMALGCLIGIQTRLQQGKR